MGIVVVIFFIFGWVNNVNNILFKGRFFCIWVIFFFGYYFYLFDSMYVVGFYK